MPYADLLEDDPARIEVRTSYADRYAIRACPGANYHPDSQSWRVKTSWAACLTLRGLFKDTLEIGPRLITWATQERTFRIARAMELRDALAIDPDDSIRGIINNIEADNGPYDRTAFDYQAADVAYLEAVRRGILANPPGLGKTGAILRTLQVLLRRDEMPFPALVVCPNTVKRTWEDEARRWAPEFRVSVIDGPAGKRRKAIDADADIYVVNWEALRIHSRLSRYGAMALSDEEKTPKELNLKGFRTVVGDEAHRLKDCHAKQTRALWAVMHQAEFRFLLTGTPVVNSMGDLWSLLHAVEPEGFPSKTRYIERWARVELGFFGGAEILGLNPETADEFRAVTQPLFRRVPKAAALPQLPPKLDVQYRYCEMSLPQARLYKAMEKDLIASASSGGLISAPNAIAQLTRLLQFASASAETYDDSGTTRVRLRMPSSKVEDLVDLLGEMGDEPLVVAAVSRQLIELAAARLAKAGITHGMITGAQSTEERQEAIRMFQDGQLRVILLTIAAGGEGITLTRASTLLFMQRDWSKVANDQMEDRLYRIGQREPVRVIDQVAPDTVEYRKIDVLADKEVRIEEIVQDEAALLRLLGG